MIQGSLLTLNSLKYFSCIPNNLAALTFFLSPVTSSQLLVQPYGADFGNERQIFCRMKERLSLTGPRCHVAREEFIAAPLRDFPGSSACKSSPAGQQGGGVGHWLPSTWPIRVLQLCVLHLPHLVGVGHKVQWGHWNGLSCEM